MHGAWLSPMRLQIRPEMDSEYVPPTRIDKDAYSLLELSVFFLGMDEVKHDVEHAGKNKGQEEGEPGEIGVSL